MIISQLLPLLAMLKNLVDLNKDRKILMKAKTLMTKNSVARQKHPNCVMLLTDKHQIDHIICVLDCW